jgi:hypothetical protein
MTAERRQRGYLCRTEVTAAPATQFEPDWRSFRSLANRSYPIAYKRKENARVEITVCWRSIGFAETVPSYLRI